jgi:hypothetical protein
VYIVIVFCFSRAKYTRITAHERPCRLYGPSERHVHNNKAYTVHCSDSRVRILFPPQLEIPLAMRQFWRKLNSDSAVRTVNGVRLVVVNMPLAWTVESAWSLVSGVASIFCPRKTSVNNILRTPIRHVTAFCCFFLPPHLHACATAKPL